MFASLCSAFTLARDFALQHISARERRRLRKGLDPIERIVRTLMIIEAVTFLLMTPEGRRIHAAAQRIEPPEPPPLRGIADPARAKTFLMPGWHTIAALRPVIDPRVVEREQREALEHSRREAEKLSRLMYDIGDPLASADLNASFRTLRWVHDRNPEPETEEAPRRRAYDPAWPILPSMELSARKALAPPAPPHDETGANLTLMRRFAALSRILANPDAAIRNLAKRLAALPRDCLPLLAPGRMTGQRPGDPELGAAIKRGLRALYAFRKTDQWVRPPEPG